MCDQSTCCMLVRFLATLCDCCVHHAHKHTHTHTKALCLTPHPQNCMRSSVLWRVLKNSSLCPYTQQFPDRVYIDKNQLIYLDSLILLYCNELNTTHTSSRGVEGGGGEGGRGEGKIEQPYKAIESLFKSQSSTVFGGRAPVTSSSDVFRLSFPLECLLLEKMHI